MKPKRIPFWVSMKNSEQNRSLVRLRSKWEDNIKIYFWRTCILFVWRWVGQVAGYGKDDNQMQVFINDGEILTT